MIDRPIAGTSTAQHTHKKRSTSITSVGFEPAIPAMQWVQTCALDSDAIGIGGEIMNLVKKKMEISWFMWLFAHNNPRGLGYLFRAYYLGHLMDIGEVEKCSSPNYSFLLCQYNCIKE